MGAYEVVNGSTLLGTDPSDPIDRYRFATFRAENGSRAIHIVSDIACRGMQLGIHDKHSDQSVGAFSRDRTNSSLRSPALH
jgi:hypothetical protein